MRVFNKAVRRRGTACIIFNGIKTTVLRPHPLPRQFSAFSRHLVKWMLSRTLGAAMDAGYLRVARTVPVSFRVSRLEAEAESSGFGRLLDR
jgi:hypothetical protein